MVLEERKKILDSDTQKWNNCKCLHIFNSPYHFRLFRTSGILLVLRIYEGENQCHLVNENIC